MRNFDMKQETVRYYRDRLLNAPILGVSVLYRKHDTKHIDVNYVEVSFSDFYQTPTHTGDKQHMRVYFDIICTNEILTENVSGQLKKLFNLGEDNNNFQLSNLRFEQMIAKIDNNRFVKRLVGDLHFTECFNE